MKKIRKILGIIAAVLFILAFVFMIARVVITGDTEISRGLVWDEAKVEACVADGGLVAYNLDYMEYLTMDGFFHVNNVRYIESTNQLEVTIRYNDSTVESFSRYAGSEPKCEPFVFELCDGDGNVIAGEYSFVADSRYMYNYRRLLFDNINPNDHQSLAVTVYFINDAAQIEGAVSSLEIYRSDYSWSAYDNPSDNPENAKHGEIFKYGLAYTEDGQYLGVEN